MKIHFLRIFIPMFITFVFLNFSALGQKVGTINGQSNLSYYIDSDSVLYVMSDQYMYYDLSESRYRQMDKPIKVPISEKVIKIVLAFSANSDNYFVLSSAGNIWNLKYNSFLEVDNSKIPPSLVDGSGTNIDILEGGVVLKRDEKYYVMDSLFQEFDSNPKTYEVSFTDLGLKTSDLKNIEVPLKINDDLAAFIRTDGTLELINFKRSYGILESFTRQVISPELNWQNLALGDGSLIAVAFDGTLIKLNNESPNEIFFKPSEISPDNVPYWKQYSSHYISGTGNIDYGIKYDGSLWYMGENNFSLIKHLKFSSDTTLYKIEVGNEWSTITLTENIAIGLKNGGQMYGWGYNNPRYFNMLQDLSVGTVYSPAQILKDVNFKDFSLNGTHVLALSDKGELHFWGRGETNSLTSTVFNEKNILPTEIKTYFKDKLFNLTYLKDGFFKETYTEPSSNYLLGSRGFAVVQSNLNNNTLKANIRFNDIDTLRIKSILKNQELIKSKKFQTFFFADKYNKTSYYFGELEVGVISYEDNWGISRERTDLIPNGYGILFSKSNIYEGFFKNGVLSGFGIVNLGDEYDNLNQVSYIGEFKEGKLNGFAKKVWADGSYYEGQWNNNVLINGTISFADEFNYTGEMSYEDNALTNERDLYQKRTGLRLQGMGKYYTVKGDTLIGEFQNGQIIGKGQLLTPSYTYEGNFERGVSSGYGIQRYRNGSTFSGEWVNGLKEGIFREITSTGITKIAIWSDDKVLIDETSPNFSTISNLSPTMLKLYLIDEGRFLSSLTNGYIYGGKSASSGGTNAAFSGTLEVNSSGIYVCDVQAIAAASTYSTINCVNLVSFQRSNGNVFLEFSGSISKKKNEYSVQSKINSQGNLERKIVEGNPAYESKTLNLTIEVNSYGQVNAFSMCFLDDRGYPDCGMGDYSGSLSKK
jgi:hypothetical protein